MSFVLLAIVVYVKAIYSRVMGLQYNAYPFELTSHTVYVLKKMSEAHDDWGYNSEPIYLFPYADGFKPTRIRDYDLANLFRYMADKEMIELIASTDKEFYSWFKTPIVGMPKMRVNTRWKLKILDQDKVRTLHKLIEVRINKFNELDLRCDLTVSNSKLYLVVNHQHYELKKFNGREARDVFRRLTIQRIVERDKDGYIKGNGVGSGMPIGSLVDVVRNAGFKKKARSLLFYKCEKDVVELKSPAILDGQEINYILDGFVDHNSKNDKFKPVANRDTWQIIRGEDDFKSS